jgi:hypothetical protein
MITETFRNEALLDALARIGLRLLDVRFDFIVV